MLSHSEGFESSILEGAAVQAACIPASWKYWQLPKWRVLAGFMVGLSSCSRSICSYNLTLIFVYSGNVPLLPNDWVGLMHGGSPLRFSEELGDNCRASVAEPKGAPKAADAQGYLPPWSINSKLVCGAPLSGSYTSRHSGPLRPPLLLLCPASALAFLFSSLVFGNSWVIKKGAGRGTSLGSRAVEHVRPPVEGGVLSAWWALGVVWICGVASSLASGVCGVGAGCIWYWVKVWVNGVVLW